MGVLTVVSQLNGAMKMKQILFTLAATMVGLCSANAVLAGPSVSIAIGVPRIVIGGPVYRPAPVYYPPAQMAYRAPRPYYAPAPVYAPVYVAPPVVIRPPPVYYAPVVVAPGYYGGHRGHGHGHGHYNRGYYGR